MVERKSSTIPINLLVLDGIGAVLVGIGLAKQFANVDVLPAFLRLEGYALGLIIGGVILMLPLIFHILGRAKPQQEAR